MVEQQNKGWAIPHSLNLSFAHPSFSLFPKERSLFRLLNRSFENSE